MKRIFAFEGDGKLRQYEGGYTDYAARKAAEAALEEEEQGGSRTAAKQETPVKKRDSGPAARRS